MLIILDYKYKSNFLNNLNFYSPFTRFWEFGIGGLISIGEKKYLFGQTFKKNQKVIVILLFTTILFLPLNLPHLFSTTTIFFLAITFLLNDVNLPKGSFTTLIESIGNKSYSIYLIHLPLIYLAKESPFTNDYKFRKIFVLISAIICFPIGALIYRLVETKYRNSIKEKSEISYEKPKKFFIVLVLINFLLFHATSIENSKGIIFSEEDVRKYTEWDPNCKLIFYTSPCKYNWDVGDKTILLIGDSHAAMFGRVLLEIASARNFKLAIWARPGCQYFSHEIVSKGNPSLNSCITSNNLSKNWVNINKPELILLSVADAEMNSKNLGLDTDLMRSLILNSFSAIDSGKTKRILILPTPRLPKYSVTNYELNGGRFMLSKSYFQANLEWDQLAKKNGIKTVNSSSFLCPQGECMKIVNNDIIFADFDHITFLGSSLLRNNISKSII